MPYTDSNASRFYHKLHQRKLNGWELEATFELHQDDGIHTVFICVDEDSGEKKTFTENGRISKPFARIVRRIWRNYRFPRLVPALVMR